MERNVAIFLPFLAEIQGNMEWCIAAREAMVRGVDDLRSTLESDSDDHAEKLAEAHKYLEAFSDTLAEMKDNLEHYVLVKEMRERCEFEMLMICQRIARIAEAMINTAAELAAEVVGPIRSAVTLAKKLVNEYFEPALRHAEAAEKIVPEMLQAAKQVYVPKGSDIQAILAEILRFKAELQALASVLKGSPILDDLKAIETYMIDAKPFMELLND